MRLRQAEAAIETAKSPPGAGEMTAHVETVRAFIGAVRARATGTTRDLARITEATQRALALAGSEIAAEFGVRLTSLDEFLAAALRQ